MLADEARRLGAVLVHYSTGYVFDGHSAHPYSEDDVATPLSVYGRSKLAGEQAIRESDVPHIVLRTGWVYGLRGRNFLQTVRRLAAEEDDLPIVSDQFGSPTWCRLIASGTAAIIARLGTGRDEVVDSARRRGGLYHMMAAGSASWHDFATSIVAATSRVGKTPVVRAIRAAEYPSAARRPNNSLLDCSRLASTFGVALPDWRVQFTLALHS